jgi:hypothetical protein
MIEDGDRECIVMQVDPERNERSPQSIQIYVSQFDAASILHLLGLLIADNLNPRFLDLCQIIVEAFRRARRCDDAMPRAQMIIRSPIRRTATHDCAGQENVLAARGCLANLARNKNRR